MDYCGGTYISQVVASSPKKAMVKAVQNLEVSEIQGLGEKTKEILWKSILDEDVIPVRDVQNVWCSMTDARGKQALLNLVQTDLAKS